MKMIHFENNIGEKMNKYTDSIYIVYVPPFPTIRTWGPPLLSRSFPICLLERRDCARWMQGIWGSLYINAAAVVLTEAISGPPE